MDLINILFMIYAISVLLSGTMMICEIYKYIKEEIIWVKRNYSNKTDEEIYTEIKNEIKKKIINGDGDQFMGLLMVFIPVVNILLFAILFISCLADYFEKSKIWDYIGEKIEKFYLNISDFLLKKQLNLKGKK